MDKNCPKCDEALLGDYDEEFTAKNSMCQECYKDSKGLIKVDNHYVPWGYRNHAELKGDSPIKEEEYFEDVHACLPTIEWCDTRKKWKVCFDGADFGGYDVRDFVWYFDSKEDIIKEMIGMTWQELG